MPAPSLSTARLWAILPDALSPLFRALADVHAHQAQEGQGGQRQAALHALLPESADDNQECVPAYSIQGEVAVISVSGTIHRTSGSFMGMSWEGQDRIRQAISHAMSNPVVRAVLLSFDSPGGVVAGTKELSDFIAAQTAKPLYAYADGLCASAAYWLASATGRVYAPRTASIGSIGVLWVHSDWSAFNAHMGIAYTYVTGGVWKAVGNANTPLLEKDQAYFQSHVSILHEMFRADVAARMGLNSSAPELWGDGQVFLAEEAQALGLVNGIVTDRDALIAQITKEIFMDKEQLLKAHPELVAQIQAEARQEAEAAAQEKQTTAASAQAALIRMVCGEDAATQVAQLAEAGVTAAQVAVLAKLPQFGTTLVVSPEASEALMAAAGNTSAIADTASRQEVLAALRSATPGPVNTSATSANNNANPVQAAINRISAVQV